MSCCLVAYLPLLFIGQWQIEERGKDICRTLPWSVRTEEDVVSIMRLYHSEDPLVRHPEECVRKIEKYIFADKFLLDFIPHAKSTQMRGGNLEFRETAMEFKNL